MTHLITATVRIQRPAAAVAGFVLDWGRDPEWRAGVRSLVCDPAGRAVVGQRQTEVLSFWGRSFETRTVVRAADALSAEYAGGQPPVLVSGSRRVVALADGECELTITTRLRLSGTMRLLAPLLVPAYRRADRTDVARLVTLLTEQVEA